VTAPDLDQWLADPAIRVVHRRHSRASADRLWDAAQAVTLQQAALLGRLIRWRIPGMRGDISFGELFRSPPFIVLDEPPGEHVIVSGLVGRIWTLRRDYPRLTDPEEFRDWTQRGTARVLFANWVQPGPQDASTLAAEARVEAIGTQGRVGVAAVRPLVRTFQGLVGSDGLEAAVRRAEQR
jgi:hypothetical protein